MRVAFTIDDLPLWPHTPYPDGYTPKGIAETFITGLERHCIPGVYAFCNSWSLLERPELARVLDAWCAAGHHVANHTHGHPKLNEVEAARYIEEIDLAERHLARWTERAPGRYFRYTLNQRGNTEEKCARVKAHLDAKRYRAAEVTSWFFEWRYNAAFEKCLAAGDREGIAWLQASFLEFSVAQLRYDVELCRRHFDREIPGIALGHNVPFFADMFDAFLQRLIDDGLEFVSLNDAANDPVYDRAASVVTPEFLVYQQKLARAAGEPPVRIAPDARNDFERVEAMAA